MQNSKRFARAVLGLARIVQAHYPDRLSRVFIVNCPAAFAALAFLVRPFLAAATLEKVHVSRGVSRELVETVGSSMLPVSLGGERQATFPYDEAAPLWQPDGESDPGSSGESEPGESTSWA